jgi:hypothetical protein
MIDDPLALAVQMIAVLAAGMYPVGFLFGTCSDCCCPACSRCTHYANETGCRSIASFSATIGEYGAVTSGFINDYNAGDCLDSVEPELEMSSFTLPCDENLTFGVLAKLAFDVPFLEDSCGCYRLFFNGGIRFQFTGDQDFFVHFNRTAEFVGPLLCDGGIKTLTIGPATFVDGTGDTPCYQEFVDFVNDLSITAEIEVATCECGACCEEGGQGVICSDNVAEGACPGDWQGVDTLCEDVTCGGTCCDAATGNCTYTLEEQCAGTWTAGGECDPNPCPQPPEGACCDGEGNCTQTIEADCSGLWSEGVECDPNPCPQPPTGACCQDGNCTETTEADCAGAWLEGVDCDPNPCTLEICCEYTDGDLTFSFGPVRADECAADFGGFVQVWQAGGETECPPTNP